MAKVFNYAVKYNGKYYAPNTPIEEAEKPAEATESVKTAEANTDKGAAEKAAEKPAEGRRKASAKKGEAE